MASFIKQFYESATYVPRRVVVPLRAAGARADRELADGAARRTASRCWCRSAARSGGLVEMAAKNARESLDMARVKWLADTGKTRDGARASCRRSSTCRRCRSASSATTSRTSRARRRWARWSCSSTGTRGRRSTAASASRRSRARTTSRRWRRCCGGASAARGSRLLRETGAEAPDVEAADARTATRSGTTSRSRRCRTSSSSMAARASSSAVLDVMREMGVKHIPTVGLAKQHEEIFVQDVSEPVVLPRTSQALYLVQRIRDEAHRFAITYHRGVRKKAGIPVGARYDPGRRAEAEEGAAEEVRVGARHPGSTGGGDRRDGRLHRRRWPRR